MEYMVEPKSRKDLRTLANQFRDWLGLENEIYFPIVQVLDVISEVIKSFSYEIVEDGDLPSCVHADTDIIKGHIRIKQSVYVRSCNGEGRDRMTIAHEIGHYFTLCVCGFKLNRNFDPLSDIPCYMNPEWQAKCFAGELLIPAHLVHDMHPCIISKNCGVSLEAAIYQHKFIR